MSDARAKSFPPPRPIPSWIAPRPVRSELRPVPFVKANRRRTTNPWLHSEPAPPSSRAPRPPDFGANGAESGPYDSMPPSQRAPSPSQRPPPPSLGQRSIAPPHIAEPTATELSLQAEIAGLKSALAEAVAMAARARREVLVASVPEVVRLAEAIAEQAIGDRLDRDPSVLTRLAREGIDALLSEDEIVVAIAPDVADKVPAEAWAPALEGRATVETDPTLAPMRCEVRAKTARVAVDPRSRLRAVLEALDDVTPGPRSEPPGEDAP